MATINDRLTEAEGAYHRLLMGTSVVEIKDQNGEMVRYTPANRGALATYIADLKQQLGQGSYTGPMRVFL